MKKIYLLFILSLLSYTTFAATQYFPSAITAAYGGTAQTVCVGTLNTATTVTYTVCGTTATGTALSVTPTWYFDGALVYTGAAFNTTTGGTITLPAGSFVYTSAGVYISTNGLYCVLTWATAAPGACAASLTVSSTPTNVTVTTAPAAIAGLTEVCHGLTITLSDPVLSGTWSSSNTTVASVSGSRTVTGGSAGTAVITFANGCGTATTTTVTVNPLPVPITGLLAACVAYTTTLSDANGGGLWSSSNSAVATVNSSSGLVTGATLGTTIITYTLPTTCIITTSVIITAPAAISGPHVVCVNQTVTLSEGNTYGHWVSGDPTLATVNATSGVVTGTSMGISNITYEIGTGCVTSFSVTVNPLEPITGRDSVCHGATTYLADIIGGGTWSSSAAGVASVNSTNGYVTGVSTGIARISYTTSLGCITTTSMTVIAIPPAITGTLNTCPGATTTLHDATSGGVWRTSNNSVATTNSTGGTGAINGVSADTVSVFYTVLPGCTVSASITVNPLPAPITGTNTICATLMDTLSDATPGGIWSTTTTSLATIGSTSGIATILAGGNVVIVYTLPVTGCKITDNISANPVPDPSIEYNWISQTFYLNTNYVYLSYQWYDSLEGLIPGATAPTLAALYTEYYYIVVTDSAGCIGQSPLYEFNTAELGIKNTTNTVINIYPNPANATVYIQSPINIKAIVTGIDGKKQLEQADAKEMNISNLADGMYFITLYDDNGQLITTRKLIKQ